MTIWKRIQNMLLVILQLFYILVLLLIPDYGKYIVIMTFQILLVALGIRYLIYYFTLARYMVDGRAILYKGGIYLDLGFFMGFSCVIPSAWVMVYLIGYFLLSGIYRSLKLLDTRKVEDRRWSRLTLIVCFYLILAILGITHLRSETVMVYLFCVEMSVSAANRLARSLKKTAIVYIQ